MTTYGMWETTPWMQNEDWGSWGFKLHEDGDPPPDKDSADYWEYTVLNFMRMNPLPNVAYPSYVNRALIERERPKSFDDLNRFELFLHSRSQKDDKGFWGACSHQWEIYLTWVELNVQAAPSAGYVFPGDSLGSSDNGKERLNTYVNIGVLKTDNPITTPGLWSKIPLLGIPFTLEYIFGDNWLSSMLSFVKTVFIETIKLLVELAVVTVKEIGKAISVEGLVTMGVLAAGALSVIVLSR